MRPARAVATLAVTAALALVAAVAPLQAEIAAGDPARALDAEAVVRDHVLPNVYTEGERARVTQVTRRGGREEMDRFVREAVIQPAEARVVVQYETGTRPRYTDTIRDGVRRQEYQVSPSRPARRIQTGQDFAIKGSAYSFRDLHWLLESYRWEEKDGSGERLHLTGRGGAYAKVVLELDRVLDTLVVTQMQLFDSEESPAKVQIFERFVHYQGKVRPTFIRMVDLGSDPESDADDIVTTLEVEWR